MSTKDDGGSAFPLNFKVLGTSMIVHDGMSMRDWFAGQIIEGLASFGKILPADSNWEEVFAEYADAAYRIADAMLERRKR